MQHTVIARRKDGVEVELTLKKLDVSYVEAIMELQEEILTGIEDHQIYVPTSKEECIEHFNTDATLLGYITKTNELVAVVIYLKLGNHPHNYGCDLDLEGEALLKVGQIDTVLVSESYRGNRLQYRLCEAVEPIAQEQNITILCATASPYNSFSVNNFKKLGYEIAKDKLKYGGLRRYVLMKTVE